MNELSTAFDEQSHRVAIAWQFEAASQTTALRLSVDEFRAVATSIGNGIKPAFRHPFIGLNRTNEIEALRRYRGQITQVRVWETMRSPLDLQQLSHADLAGNEPGLLHYLPMAEGERTTLNDWASDVPVKFKSLSLPHPNPTWVEADYAIELNGKGDFIDIADYQPGDVGSLELWVKFDLSRRQVLLDASTDERHLIGTNQPKAFVISLIRPSGHPVLRFYLEDSVDRDFYADLDLRNLNVADFEATWHHLVATWHYQPDNNTIAAQLFLDHLPPATARQKISERASGRHSGFRSVYIGKNRGDYGAVANRSFQGQVGHFRAWNRVLPVADISLLQNMPWQGIGTGPIVDLPLTEGTGTLLGAQAPTATTATLTLPAESAVSRWVVSDRAVAIDHPETFITCPNYIPGPIGTIELWVKFNRDRDQYLLDASGEADADFFVDVVAGQLRFQINDSTAALDLTAFPPAFDTAWHHIVATWKYDAQDQRLDLLLDSSATASGRDDLAFPACRSLYIGVLRGESDQLSDYRTLQGEVSQLRIWNQAATTESDFLTNIHRRRYADLTGNEAGLLVYLPMEAGAGHTLNNQAPGSAATIMYGRFPDVRWVRNPATLLQWRGGYGVLPTTAELGLTDTYTLAAWIYLPDLAGTHPILGTRGPVVDAIAATWVWGLRDGSLFVRVADQELVAADLPLTANTWHHVVCQYDQANQSLRLGRDGVISTSTLEDITPYTVDRTLYFGLWQRWQATDSDWVRSHFQGLIADLQVWSAALTAEALAQSRDRRLRGDEPDLRAYWTLTGEQRHRLPALGNNPHWAYLSRNFQNLDLYEAAQPPLYTPRQAPTLDGYNDYLALNEASFLNQPHTIEFWFADTPDQWQHLAIVDGANGEPQFFLNGELIADPSPDLVAKRYAYRMNTRATDRPARNSAGQLAVTAGPVTDLRLWRTVRTQDEIQVHYQRHLTGREDDLWAYWPVAMGSGDRLPDATENHRAATLVAGLENTADKWQADPPPQTGSIEALYFDGRDDHLASGDVADWPFNQAFTVEAWVKLPPEPSPDLLPILATIPSDGPDAVDAGRLMMGLKAGRPYFSLEATSFLQADQPLDSDWHHLAWQYEPTSPDAAGTLRIWVDGVQVAEANYRRPFRGAGTLYIGRGQAVDRAAKTVTPRYFQGGLGEVRIWRSLRTADEIRDRRDRPLVGDTDTLTDLAAYWIFDVAVTTVIPSQVITDGSRYDLVLQSDEERSQPTWTAATHPIWLNPLPAAALSFDGERQHLATTIPLTIAPPFTLEVWVRVADWTEERPIVRWGLPGSVAGFELTVTTEGKVALQWGATVAGPTTASPNSLITDESIAMNAFTHIALVASADEQTDEVQLALLINGDNAQSATLTTPLLGQSLPLLVGQGGTPAAPTHFKGWLKEVRLWQSDRTTALLDHLYHPLTGQEAQLLSSWPLNQIEASEGDRLTPNQVANRPALRLGGLPSSRKPTAGEPTQFWDSRHRVLTLPVMPSPPLELVVPGFATANYPHRAQRTIEVWFLCRDLASGQKQVIYGEGDETRGLEIYVQSGSLHLAGWNTPIAESGWSGSTISTDRLQANHWHHVALVLNGKDELRDDAFRALLDGRAIATRPGSQLWGHTPTITVGGLTFTPNPQSTIQPVTVEHSLHGQIREVRIWEAVRTDAQIQAALWGLPENLPESDRQSLLFHWDTTTLTGHLVAPMVLPNPMEAAISSPDLPLIDLAKLHQLQAEWQAPLEQLCALWAPLRHVGQRDRQTWFDRIFNPAGVEPYWSYAQRLPWQVHSDDPSQRQIRTRLLSTLRVSQAELQVMVQAISGVNAEQIVLDGHYLTSLYRLKLLASLLRLAITDLVGLMARLEEESTGEPPFHDLANFTLSDVLQLKERADWMASAGITLAEYEYLAYNVQSQAIALPYTEAMLVDTATTLLNQSADLLLTPLSLAADAATITDAAAAAIYAVLQARNLVEEIELALPTPTGDFRSIKRGVVMPAVLSLKAGDPELAELQQAILLAVATAMNWATSFDGSELGVSKQTLLDQKIIASDPEESGETTGLVLKPISVDPDRPIAEQTLLRDLLVNRLELQRAIPQAVLTRLQDQRRAFDATLLTDFASLLDTDAERLLNTMQDTTGQLYDQGVWDASQLMQQLNQIVKAPDLVTASLVDQDLRQLHKILLLLAQFNLSEAETQLLLTQSQAIFGINPAHLFTPTLRDLQRLYTFTQLKQSLRDRNDGLIQVLQQQTPLHEFTGWVESDIPKVAEKLHIPASTYHALPAIARLHQAFALIQQLQIEPAALFELADFRDRTFATYQDHAATVLGLMRAQYTEEQWPKVYQPLHDRLAEQKRDALTAVILEKLSDQLGDRKTPNILYEYLLIDVQTGSAVETSRIVQGIASLQLYVQRCLMNLEHGVNPEQISLKEWEWMKNYRVWEANRKVFLYPENYIEPELRDTKTPLFKELEDALQQGNVTKETVTQAYTTYLNNFAEVANLTIIGSYYNTNRPPQTGSALTFSGQDFITVSSLAEAKALIPQNFTIELWVKPTLAPSGWGGIASAYNLADDKTNSGGWILEVGQSRFKFHLKTASTGSAFAYLHANFVPDQWYHLAVTYDGTHARLYLNAKEKAAIACSGAIAYPPNLTDDHQFVLGARKDANYQANFVGQLREIRLWNTARSAEQIEARMDEEITDPQKELPASDRAALLRCWNRDASRAIATDTGVTDFSDAQQGLSFTPPTVRWQSTPLVETVYQDEVDEKTTLYLVGRNEVTQECYIRELINQRRWTPWRKLGITINAQFVSPVFAFNRLFLFWAEIQDHVRPERRKWVANNSSNKPIDQIGNEIKLLKAPEKELKLSTGEILNEATINENGLIDNFDGGTLNPTTLEFSDKHGIETYVNIPVKKPILKFSYAKFSQDWIEPLIVNHASTDLQQKELGIWEQLQPDWLRIYAQRWRGSDVTPLVQRPPQTLPDISVTQLGPDSYLSFQVPDFTPISHVTANSTTTVESTITTVHMTFSFWLQINQLQPDKSTSKARPRVDTITLVTYGDSESNRLRLQITHNPTPIDEKPQFMEAVDQSYAAVSSARSALQAITDFLAADTTATRNQLAAQRTSIDNQTAAVKASFEAIRSIDNQNAAPRTLAIAAFDWLKAIQQVFIQVNVLDGAATAQKQPETVKLAGLVAAQANQATAIAAVAKQIVPTANTTVVANAAQTTQEAAEDAAAKDKTPTEATASTQEAIRRSLTGLNDANGLGQILDLVVKQEATVEKWERGRPRFICQLGNSAFWEVDNQKLSDLPTQQWLHVVWTPSERLEIRRNIGILGRLLGIPRNTGLFGSVTRSGNVTSNISVYDVEGSFSLNSSVTGILPQPGQTLSIGAANNPPATAEQDGQFQAQMSEFRVWDTLRREEVIAAERLERKHGKERGLQVYLPLDSDRFDDQPLTLVDSKLTLIQTFAPEQPIVEGDRERILLLYGDYAFSLRNTLKDTGFSYELLKNAAAQDNYDLSLGLQKQGVSAIAGDDQETNAVAGDDQETNAIAADGQETSAIGVVGQETDARIRVEQYRSDQIPPLDRFLPEARSKALKDELASARPAVITQARDEWEDYAQNQILLVNEGDVQLDIAASYIMDVHNQPGSWILDIGDQVFWVKINIDQLRLLTAEERLRANPAQKQPTLGAGQAFELYYDRDRALEVRDGVIPKFEFTRLNTFAVQTLSEKLLGEEGISDLLSIDSQNLSEPDFDKLANLEENRIVAPRYRPDGSLDNRIDFSGAYGIYYREIFFHIPLLIANKLSADQRFAEAQEWYHYIFNPTAQEPPDSTVANTKDRYWRYRAFRQLSLETITELLSDETALETYRTDPSAPHAIAALRINTYQKTVVMKYIKNLLDWGDSLFRQDTREAINDATQLYVLANTLMGARPISKPAPTPATVGSYRDIETALERTVANPIPDFLIPTPGANGGQPLVKAIPFDPNRTVTTRFGVPANDYFIGFWDQIDDRLFKIRHSLNIDGVFRSLSLFEPPIDPAALVRAAAGGNLSSAISAAAAGNAAFTPHYRYSVMLEQAKAYTDLVTDFGAALLDALTNRDDAALAQLERTHEQALLQQTTDLKQWAIEEAKLNKEELKLSYAEAEHRYSFFDTEMNKTKPFGASGLEVTGLVLRGTQIAAELTAAVIAAIAAATASVVVEVETGGSGFGATPVATVKTSGGKISKPVEYFGKGLELAGGVMGDLADLLEKLADYENRYKEWKRDRESANYDKLQIEKQIEQADIQIQTSERELANHQLEIEQHQEIAAFHKRKFANGELYNWMANRLSTLYFQAYNLAYDLAKQAERAYQFEFASNDTFINFGYWDNRRRGLLAGEALKLDLARLEKTALDNDSRYMEITKTISLSRINPIAFLELRKTGRCQFSLDEMLFARDFPGHYFRVIKALSISIPAVVGPYQSVNAMLTQTGHKTLLEPDMDGGEFMMGLSTDRPASVRVNWRANQQIAISTAIEDGGVFELDFNDDRYLPFENTGVVSNWLLEVPRDTNFFDYDTITDVILHLRYMSVPDSGSFRAAVRDLDEFKAYRSARLFNVSQEFPAQWHAFTQTEINTLELPISPHTFPPNVELAPFNEEAISAIYGITLQGEIKMDLKDEFGADIVPSETTPGTYSIVLTAEGVKDKSQLAVMMVILKYEGELKRTRA
ncbi:MAG: LamG-like jellyroll fold domain-containing protein [Leptolyngbyaceae cyanobacterium]